MIFIFKINIFLFLAIQFCITDTIYSNSWIDSCDPNMYDQNVNQNSEIIITFNTDIKSTSLSANTIIIHGSKSGYHNNLIIDFIELNNRVVLNSQKNFCLGEIVNICLTDKIQNLQDEYMPSSFNWSFRIETTSGNADFEEIQSQNIGFYVKEVCCMYFNDDEYLDLVIGNDEKSGKVITLLNNGDGSFNVHSSILIGHPYNMSAGDFNKDGLNDIAVAKYNHSPSLSILLNDGLGNFIESSTLSVMRNPVCILNNDLTGDGNLDLIVAGSETNSIEVLQNDGDANFVSIYHQELNDYPNSLGVIDCNNDGHFDFIVTEPKLLSLYINNGKNEFQAVDSIKLNYNSSRISSGDFNCDGFVDLAISHPYSNMLSILTNDTNGHFVVKSINSIECSYDLISDDFNFDSKIDLATINSSTSGSLCILLNDGDANFTSLSTINTGSNPSAIVSGDFNKDGSSDICLVCDVGSDNFFIFKNTFSTEINDNSSKNLFSKSEIELDQNYPNPFNSRTTIKYSLIKTTSVNLSVYDIYGCKIKTIINTIQNEGEHSIIFDAIELPSGIYIYRLKADYLLKVQKMLLVK